MSQGWFGTVSQTVQLINYKIHSSCCKLDSFLYMGFDIFAKTKWKILIFQTYKSLLESAIKDTN